MEKILIVVSVSEQREFQSKDGENVKALDVTLSDGLNTFIASAVDKRAQQMIDHPVKPGSLINADLTFNVTSVKSERGEFPTQRVSLRSYSVLIAGE